MYAGSCKKIQCKTQTHGDEAADDAAGVGDGYGSAQETEVQKGEEHAASQGFERGFGDDQDETDQANAALG